MRIGYITGIALLYSMVSNAQSPDSVKTHSLSEVVVTESLQDMKNKRSSLHIDVVGKDILQQNFSGNLIQALDNIPGSKYDDNGKLIEVYAEYDAMTKSGMPDSNRKVKGTIHWVSTQDSIDAEVRLYDRLFIVENPADDERDFRELLNPDSLKVLTGCKIESYLKNAGVGDKFQFQRTGYFCVDTESSPDKLIFNRTVSLKDSWSKVKEKGQQ